jgi:hypothetical protein
MLLGIPTIRQRPSSSTRSDRTTTAAIIPVAFAGIDSPVEACIGRRDTVEGIVEIWVINNSLGRRVMQALYLYKADVRGATTRPT